MNRSAFFSLTVLASASWLDAAAEPGSSTAAAPAATRQPVAVQTAPDGNGQLRAWTDSKGRVLQATFRGVENGNVFLQIANGYVYRLPIDTLSPESQHLARTLKPEGLGIPADPNLAQAAARVDQIVLAGLKKANQQPNALASDEQFVRRVYLDIAGRIPTREETLAFLNDTSVSKRGKVIDHLLASDGFNSRMFNYFSDMLRMADDAQKGRFYTYQEWFKDQLRQNRPWNETVRDMLSADGKLLENGATGYLLRDRGMPLDNLSLTLSNFLGANVSCAQCHDHPFAEWTQKQFYEMASFFGATETYEKGGKRAYGREMRAAMNELPRQQQQRARNLLRINGFDVEDKEANTIRLPDDYKYKDAKPGDSVAPKLVTWSDADKNLPSYKNVETKEPSALRSQFAQWMTSPDNPRFAMAIANRLWKVAFGVAVREPVTDLDDPTSASNPELLLHLANEMRRVKFNLRDFFRIVYNTQTYQREAITKEVNLGEPYLFPGPLLRRMSAEQAWDACVTLAIGDKVDTYHLKRAETFSKAVSMNLSEITPETLASKVDEAYQVMRSMGTPKNAGNAKAQARKRQRMMQRMGEEEDDLGERPAMLDGLVLARASELPQPARDDHFLRMFGQSDRTISDSSSGEGSIPQVMMLMNGEAQHVIGSNRSLVYQTALNQESAEQKVTSLYLSFLSRNPQPEELAKATAALDSGLSIRDLTWVLFNSREFVFVQ